MVLSHDEVFLHKNGDAVSLQFRPKSLVISSVTETGNVVYTFFLVHYFFELNYHVMQSHCKHGKILYFDSCIRLGHEQMWRDRNFPEISKQSNFTFDWERLNVSLQYFLCMLFIIHDSIIMQIPEQEDGSSCGIIMLHLCENIIKFAESCDYDFSKLSSMTVADLAVEAVVRTSKSYRLHLGRLLMAIFNCATRTCSYNTDGMKVLMHFSLNIYDIYNSRCK